MVDSIDEKVKAEVEAGLRDNTRIGRLGLEDAHGKWVLDPKADITALEATLIGAMLAKMLQAGRRLDWRDYLTRPHATPGDDGEIVLPCLKRHFREAREGE